MKCMYSPPKSPSLLKERGGLIFDNELIIMILFLLFASAERGKAFSAFRLRRKGVSTCLFKISVQELEKLPLPDN
jgi:hypothetical protein